MMKTESFNWQRPAKICNGVKDFGLLREKLANTEDIKRRSFSSIYISRAIFIVGVIAVITFVICLVLADKYQKSMNLSHHYASFVYEKNQHEERLRYGRFRENEQAEKEHDEYDRSNENDGVGARQGVFNGPDFVKLRNLSDKLPIEEINLLVPVPVAVTTVLRSLNVSRNGRQFWSGGGAAADDRRKVAQSTITAATTKANASNAAVVKKHPGHGIQSLADLLRRTELKTATVAPSNGRNDETDVAASATAKSATTIATAVATSTPQTSIHFAQLESYPRRTHNNNLQHLIEYINCQSSNDCWMQRHADPAATAVVIEPNRTQTSSAFGTSQPDGERRYSEQPDADTNERGYIDNYETVETPRTQAAITRQYEKNISPLSTAYDNGAPTNANENGNDDSDRDDETDDDHHLRDFMFAADSQSAPLYSPPYLTVHRDRVNVNPDLFRHFRASSPLEINRLQLDDQTESAAGVATSSEQMLNQHHRFSNRMYHNRDGGVNNFETYALDLEPYLKPPTPPPPTMLSFTPSYATTTIFHAFNDQSSASSALHLHETDLRSEATAVEPIVSQIKPISLMVEIFPANEYELPGSVFGGGGDNGIGNGNNGGGKGDVRMTAYAAQQRDPTLGSVSGGAGANSNRANIASSMSWKLAQFSQNKMRLLVNLFPQLGAPAIAHA